MPEGPVAIAVEPDPAGDCVRIGVFDAMTRKYLFQFTVSEGYARQLAGKLTRAAWAVQDNTDGGEWRDGS
jgi:hypothetical protein